MHSGGVCQRSQTASCIAVLSYLAACSHCCAMTDINTCFVVCHVSALLACVGLAWVNHVVVMQRWWCIWLEGGDLPCGSVTTQCGAHVLAYVPATPGSACSFSSVAPCCDIGAFEIAYVNNGTVTCHLFPSSACNHVASRRL